MKSDNIKKFLEQAHRYGASELMRCSSGNISWRIGNKAYVSGTGSWLENLTEEQISISQIESGETQNDVRPSMESTFHLEVLRERSDVNIVLHFQSEYATAVACLKEKPTNFNVIAEVPAHVGRNIPVIPYLRPGSPQLANAVSEAMREHNAVLLTNHGQVV